MRARILIFEVIFAVLFFACLSYSEVPQMINYQGKLTDPQGALIDTTLAMVFSIYVDESGMTAPLWSETQDSVKVEKGIFSVLLGSVNSIPDSVFTGAVRYLGVKVGADPEMTPRKSIVSVAYAYKSEYADTAGYAQVAVSDGDWTISGSNIYRLTGNVGIGTTNPVNKLTVNGTVRQQGASSDGNPGIHVGDSSVRLFQTDDGNTSLGIITNSTEKVRILGNGNVGIGTSNPSNPVWVNGTVLEIVEPTQNDAATVVLRNLNSEIDNSNGAIVFGNQGEPDICRIVGGTDEALNSGRIYLTTANEGIYSTKMMIKANGNVGIGTLSPQGVLDVSSTTGAFIVPRMTTAQRDALSAVNGMIIYNTTTNQFNFYENGAWVTK